MGATQSPASTSPAARWSAATRLARKRYSPYQLIAVVRSGGKNPQLKGVVHEILYRDSLTMAPKNLASGAKGALSKSVTAVRDDVLLKQGGSVVGRAQLKDAVASADKVARQAASGKYAGTKLMGTKETVAAYEKAAANLAKNGTKVTQKMTSTGISSADTSRIAAQTIGGSLKAAQLGKAALASSGTGAALSGVIEAVSSGVKLAKGEIDGGEFAANVAQEALGGGFAAAGGTAAATAVSIGAATLLAGTTAPLWLPGAVGVGAAVAAGSAIKSAWDGVAGGIRDFFCI